MLAALPFHDTTDFADAARGLIAPLADGVIRGREGHALWNLNDFAFLDREAAPPEVIPSLWRLARLNTANGLFEVTEGVYQIRGLDLASMTIVEGAHGIVVIDALTFAEAAAAGLALYRAHRGDRPVTALVYTHSHGDLTQRIGVSSPAPAARVTTTRAAFDRLVGGQRRLRRPAGGR